MMETYFAERENLKLTILVVDMRHKPTADDVLMYDYLKQLGFPCMVIATKLDKLNKSQINKQLKVIKETLQLEPEDQMSCFSVDTSQGKDIAWKVIDDNIK